MIGVDVGLYLLAKIFPGWTKNSNGCFLILVRSKSSATANFRAILMSDGSGQTYYQRQKACYTAHGWSPSWTYVLGLNPPIPELDRIGWRAKSRKSSFMMNTKQCKTLCIHCIVILYHSNCTTMIFTMFCIIYSLYIYIYIRLIQNAQLKAPLANRRW